MIREINKYDDFLEVVKTIDINQNAYMSYEYLQVFCSFHPEMEKYFIAFVYYEGNKAIGVLPLVKHKMFYTILGYRYSNYQGYIATQSSIDETHVEISSYIEKKHKNMVILYYDINDCTIEYSIFSKNIKAKKIHLYNCPYCSTDEPYDQLLMRQIKKSKKRTELRKFEHKLCNLGKIEVINIDDYSTYCKYKGLIGEIYDIHRRRFIGDYIPANLSLNKNEEYYSTLFENMVKSNKAYLSLMTLDGIVISFVYSIISNETVMDWMPAFDPVFSKYNLGTVHLTKIFEYLCSKEDYKVFDFSKGDGIYKDRWSNGITANYAFVVCYSNKILPNLRKILIYSFFRFKSYLREKGIIEKVKSFIGHKKINQEIGSKFIVVYENNKSEIMKKFMFSDLKALSFELQTEILNCFYSDPFDYYFVDDNCIHILKK